MKKNILISTLFTLFIIGNLVGQKSNLPGKLPWVNGNLPANSINYNYKVVQGDASTLVEAQNRALEDLIFQMGSEQGFSVSSETMVKTQSLVKNNKEDYSMDFQDKTVINQDKFKAVFSKVDEYFEKTTDINGNSIFRTWQLYVTGPSANDNIPKINYSNKYGMNDAGFKSLIIPGWGQFYKKKNGKGLMFLLGTAGSLGGFIYANNEHSNNMNRSKETNDIALKRQYVEKAGDFTTLKNITLGAAVGLWIWNVIDATSTPGATKYAQNKPIKLNLVSDQNSSLALNFKYKF